MNTTKRRARPRLSRTAVHLVLLGLCALWVIPVLALLVSSFRDAYAISTTGWWTTLADASSLTLRNYEVVLFEKGMGRALLNSLLITVPAVVMMTTLGAVTSYALARMQVPGKKAFMAILLALLVIPLQMTLVPVLKLYNATDLSGTFPGIWLVHTGFGLPFAIYLMHNFFAALPQELFEAAALDGASERQAFFRVALPVALPALASVAIFQLIWVWNDLLISLIFLGGSPDVAPLTVAIANLVNATTGEGWELLTAAAFVALAVPMMVFFALQKYFVRGVLAGAVK